MEKIKKELKYFNIEKSYGGNQRWMRDWWMHIGGCAALTACDVLIYCALHRKKPEYYPYDINSLTKKDYRRFSKLMRLYLQPRVGGIKDIETFIYGVKSYFEDNGIDGISLKLLEGNKSFDEAKERIIAQIDSEMPAAYLMLKHQDKEFDFFEWHWFVVNGYEIRDDGFYIKVATYGAAHWLNFEKLWNTGYEEKGGIVFYENTDF